MLLIKPVVFVLFCFLSHSIAEHISVWKSENRPAVWLHIPTFLGELIPVATEQGFTLHHAKGEVIVMSRWLHENRPNKLPHYASHQVGVCGELCVQWNPSNPDTIGT